MKKLLILNGSHSDIQLIKAGKELGYYVITTGNSSDLIGHKYADEYCCADFSDCEAVLELAKSLEIDAICSCANDFGAITSAYVAEKMGLGGHDSYETTLKLHHKDKFKVVSKEYNVITPQADGYDSVEDAIANKDKYQLPLIIKPIDLTGGKGVTKVFDWDDFEPALNKAYSMSRQKRFVIEPFIVGTYHSFSTFVVDKEVRASFSDDELSYINPFLVTTSAGPATGIESVKDILLRESNRIVKLLDLVDGVFHIQYIMDKNQKPYIIEITRRCSGDWYSEPVRKALGVDWAKWIVKSQVGISCSEFPKDLKQEGFCGRHCLMGDKNGIVKEIVISESVKSNIYDSFQWWEKGDKISNFKVDKLGILFLEYGSQEEMDAKAPKLNELIKVVVE